MQGVDLAVCEWFQRLPLAFALDEDILSTCCNKEDVTFWDATVANRVCRFSFNYF